MVNSFSSLFFLIIIIWSIFKKKMKKAQKLVGVAISVIGIFSFIFTVINKGNHLIALSAVITFCGYIIFKKS